VKIDSIGAVGEFVQVRFTGELHARFEQRLDRRRGGGGGLLELERVPASGRIAGDIEEVFHAERQAG